MVASKKTWGKVLLSRLGALIIICCMFVTVSVVIMLLLYFKYHASECAQYEPSSQFLIGDIVVLRLCPLPTELVIEALVESYSDGGKPDA